MLYGDGGRDQTLLLIGSVAEVELPGAEIDFSPYIELAGTAIASLPSKTADTTIQYSDSSSSVRSITCMNVGSSLSN
jgi:hypothetical protein